MTREQRSRSGCIATFHAHEAHNAPTSWCLQARCKCRCLSSLDYDLVRELQRLRALFCTEQHASQSAPDSKYRPAKNVHE